MLTQCKTAALRIFYGFFALIFLWMTVHIIMNGGWYYYGNTETGLLVCTALALGVLALLWRLIKVQLLLGLRLRYKPVFDIDAVFGGAVQWARTGSFPDYYDYYYTFFNNFGGLRFMYWIQRLAAALGVHDPYLIARRRGSCWASGGR